MAHELLTRVELSYDQGTFEGSATHLFELVDQAAQLRPVCITFTSVIIIIPFNLCSTKLFLFFSELEKPFCCTSELPHYWFKTTLCFGTWALVVTAGNITAAPGGVSNPTGGAVPTALGKPDGRTPGAILGPCDGNTSCAAAPS